MSHLFKNLLIALGVTVILGVLYAVLFREGTPEEGPVIAQEKTEAAKATEKILSDIREINEYKLDDSIFEDGRFTSLKDYRVNIRDVDTGRDNPFEPVE